MTTWLETFSAPECAHEPDPRGVKCAHCGIPAEMVPPDELAAAMIAAQRDLEIRRSGQLGWVETCNGCDAMGPVDPDMGYCAACCAEIGALVTAVRATR